MFGKNTLVKIQLPEAGDRLTYQGNVVEWNLSMRPMLHSGDKPL